ATLAADDPALHLICLQLDDADGGLRSMARRDPLERVGDEVSRAPPGFDLCLLFELPDAPRELVPDELLRPREHLRLRLVHGQPGDSLELFQLALLRRLELLLELPRVRLAVGDPLLAALELGHTPLHLVLPRAKTLLDLDRLRPAHVQVMLDLAPMPDRLFLRLQLGLALQRLGLAARLGEKELTRAPGCRQARPREQAKAEKHRGDPDSETDENADRDRHVDSWVGCPRRKPRAHRAPSRHGRSCANRSSRGGRPPREPL